MLYILNAVFPTGFGETRRGWTLHEGSVGIFVQKKTLHILKLNTSTSQKIRIS